MWTYINWLRIDREVVDDLFHAEKVGNKHFKDFLEKLVEDKKSFFEPFCKASLVPGNEKIAF